MILSVLQGHRSMEMQRRVMMKMGMKILRKGLVVAANQRVLQCKRRMQRVNILEKKLNLRMKRI